MVNLEIYWHCFRQQNQVFKVLSLTMSDLKLIYFFLYKLLNKLRNGVATYLITPEVFFSDNTSKKSNKWELRF